MTGNTQLEPASTNESPSPSPKGGSGGDLIQGGTISDVDQGVPWHEPRHRAETARALALLLVWILVISFGLHYVTTTVFSCLDRPKVVEALASIYQTWLPVVSGFVGGAVTFYFTRERK